jgi:hypothetical protein
VGNLADDAMRILAAATPDEQRAVLAWLRQRHPIHHFESVLRVPAEVILEAIARSPDLSQRGVRGLIAEAYFDQMVTAGVPGWEKDTPPGNHSFDCRLRRGDQTVRIQVKSQRRKAGKPMSAKSGYKFLSPDKVVVETQKTRAGEGEDGADTRPYRFGEFDLLAVSVEASTGDWTQFRYTVERWLLPRPDDANLLLKFQPISLAPDADWTDHLPTAIEWFLSGEQKRIAP